jgi:hypothetical protein
MNLFMKRLTYILLACLTMLAASSCSTTRVLQDEEYRLARNRIVITNDKEFNTNSLEPYLKQKPNPAILFGWNPFLYVYNWSNGKGKTWDKLVQGLGVEPVVYEADMVDATIENMLSRLTYIGYYGSTIESKIDVKKKDVNVTYNITLGKRLPIKDIEIVLPEEGTFAEDFLADTSAMLINIGDYLSEDILEKESVAYQCDCSREKMEKALIAMGRRDLNELIEEDEGAELTCHFCRTSHQFTKEDLIALMERATR